MSPTIPHSFVSDVIFCVVTEYYESRIPYTVGLMVLKKNKHCTILGNIYVFD